MKKKERIKKEWDMRKVLFWSKSVKKKEPDAFKGATTLVDLYNGYIEKKKKDEQRNKERK